MRRVKGGRGWFATPKTDPSPRTDGRTTFQRPIETINLTPQSISGDRGGMQKTKGCAPFRLSWPPCCSLPRHQHQFGSFSNPTVQKDTSFFTKRRLPLPRAINNAEEIASARIDVSLTRTNPHTHTRTDSASGRVSLAMQSASPNSAARVRVAERLRPAGRTLLRHLRRVL